MKENTHVKYYLQVLGECYDLLGRVDGPSLLVEYLHPRIRQVNEVRQQGQHPHDWQSVTVNGESDHEDDHLTCIFAVSAPFSLLHSTAKQCPQTVLVDYWLIFLCELFGLEVLEHYEMAEAKEGSNEKEDHPRVNIELKFAGAAIGIARDAIEGLNDEEEAEGDKLKADQIKERERGVVLPFVLIRWRILQPNHQRNDVMGGE